MQHSAVVSRSSAGDVAHLLSGDAADEIDFELGPVRLEGGHSADLYRFRLSAGPADLRDRDLVLRLLPPREASDGEMVIQRGVARLGYPAPEILRWGVNDESRRYLIMAFVEGRTLFRAESLLGAFRRIPPRLASLMVALHDLDPAPVRESLAELADSAAIDAQARALADVERSLAAVEHPARHALHRWFDAHRPEAVREVVCHGDLHALNVLVNGEVAVIDWEMAAIGDPAFDIARTKLLLNAVPMEIPAAARPLLQRLGRRAASRFEAAYLALSPVPAQAIHWYEALHAARMASLILAARLEPAPVDAVISAWAPTIPLLATSLELHTGVDIVV